MIQKKEQANIEIVEHANKIIHSEKTFYNCLFKEKNVLNELFSDVFDYYNVEDEIEV